MRYHEVITTEYINHITEKWTNKHISLDGTVQSFYWKELPSIKRGFLVSKGSLSTVGTTYIKGFLYTKLILDTVIVLINN